MGKEKKDKCRRDRSFEKYPFFSLLFGYKRAVRLCCEQRKMSVIDYEYQQ